MRTIKNYYVIALIAMIGIAFNACKKDEPETVTGEALFSYVTDGLKVTFTNTSSISGSVTYAWDFGDEKGTSTEKDPIYTYEKKGEYTVTLTVADEQGGKHPIATKINVDKSSPVKLDDKSFDDWSTIQDAFTPVVAQAGAVQSFKYDYDSENIYFYLKVKNDSSWQICDLLIDTSLDTIGYKYDIFPTFKGAELLIEGGFTDAREGNEDYWFSWAPWNPDGTEWDDGDTEQSIWPIDEAKQTDDYRVDGTFKASGTYVELEFSISRIKIDQLKGIEMVEVVGWTSDATWEENGWLPNKNPADNSNPNAGGIVIDMR